MRGGITEVGRGFGVAPTPSGGEDHLVYGFEETGRVRRAVRIAVTSRPVAALSARFLPGIDRLTSRPTSGRGVFSAWATGLPIIPTGVWLSGARPPRSP